MAQIKVVHSNICEACNIRRHNIQRKHIKSLLIDKLPNVEFHQPKHLNEPERVSYKHTRDAAIQIAEQELLTQNSVKCIFEAASILRKLILQSSRWAS